jgi:peptide/nickel transport system substrate-binding protein
VNAIGKPIAYVFIISPTGDLFYSTNASSPVTGAVNVTLPQSVTAKMTPGTYTLLIYVLTDVVKVPAQYTTSLAVTPYAPPSAPPSGVSLPVIIAVVIIVVIVAALAAWFLTRRR